VPAGMARWGAAVPPVAVLAGLEVLLLQVRRAVHRHDPADRLPPAATAAASHRQVPSHPAAIEQPDRAGLPADYTPEAAAAPSGTEPPAAASGPQAEAAPTLLVGVPEVSAAEVVARQQARQFYDQQTAAGQRVTGAALGRAIGRSERYGRLLLAEFRTAAEQERTPNGERRPSTGSSPTT
jgi:cytoskeletal protein RodZ